MNRAKIIIVVISIIGIIIMGVITGLIVSENKYKNYASITYVDSNSKELSKAQKKIAGIEGEKNTVEKKAEEKKEENYSEIYKEYLKLPEAEKEKIDIVPREQEVEIDKLDEIKKYLDSNTIPERFSLAENINIKVENQGSYGLCWGFASLNTLETYLALNERKDYDFSEMHLNYIESDLLYGYREIDQGGNFDIFKDYVNISGVVLESDVPYKNYSEKEYSKFIDMKPVSLVTETVDFPTIYKTEYSEYTDEEIKDFRDTVKRHIMQNGGIYAEVIASGERNAYNHESTTEFINHAITIVGWDDNYSKDNFPMSNGHKPSKDGAYIALNSWGSGWNDKGYYYISYEDKYVESGMSGVVSTSLDSAYKISSIKNEVLRNYLKDNYNHLFINVNGEDYITKNSVSSIHFLNLNNLGLTSLNGLDIFPNIYSIDISNNKISDVSSLSVLLKYKDLYYMNLSNNKIKDISEFGKKLGDNYYSIDLSNNELISGYKYLKNATAIDLRGCKIKKLEDIKDLENIWRLDLSNNPEIEFENSLPTDIWNLVLDNCNLEDKDLEALTGKNNFDYLSIAGNNITTLNSLKDINYIGELNISNNKIEDWSFLEKYSNTEFNLENNENFIVTIEALRAENCEIDDLSLFSNLNIGELYLANNKITQIPKIENNNIYCIDLSGNTELKGIENLKNISTVVLNNCKLDSLEFITEFENVLNLSIENNNITKLPDISKMNNLYSLSLADNKEFDGKISSNYLRILNLKGCNVNDDLDLSDVQWLYDLNLLENPNITNAYNVLRKLKSNYTFVMIEEIDSNSYKKIENMATKSIYFDSNTKVVFESEIENDNQINLKSDDFIKYLIDKNIGKKITVENGTLNKKSLIIHISDLSLDCVSITFEGYNTKLLGMNTIILKYRTIENEDVSNTVTEEENAISNNTVLENTVLNEIIENIVDNSVNNNVNNIIENESNIENDLNTIKNEIENEVIVNNNIEESNTLGEIETQNLIENEIVNETIIEDEII